jgi:radical SAM superfamily enzyme YgiQ (UPF0313 family)
MKILFISANTEVLTMPTFPLGLACVATATSRAGHQVKLVDLMQEKDWKPYLINAIEEFNPDIIGISVRNIDDQSMKNTAFLLKKVRAVVAHCRAITEAPIILGGAGYSMFPESVLAYLGADMGIKGEGETALPVLLDYMEREKDPADIPGVCLSEYGSRRTNGFVQDLDALPFPDDDLWLPSQLRYQDIWIPFQTRRGCPMNCSYCSSPSLEGGRIRKHAPQAVVDVIARQVKAGFRKFYFTDNTFNIPSSYAKEICHSLLAGGLEISWMCILYPWGIDEDLVQDMARTGCEEVSLGFESGCQRILDSMNKKYTREEVRRTSELLARSGIRQMGFLLLGGPGETRASVEESLAFA